MHKQNREGGEAMRESKNLLTYCGLYCGDCAGYSSEIADTAQNLMNVLEKYRFERTANCLFPEKLKDYDRFCEMLGFMTDLKCLTICRERDDSSTSCEIRRCCRDKGFYACYGCDDSEMCEKLKTLEGLHGDSCVKNLKAIREMGLEAWIRRGKRLWFGSDVDNCPYSERTCAFEIVCGKL